MNMTEITVGGCAPETLQHQSRVRADAGWRLTRAGGQADERQVLRAGLGCSSAFRIGALALDCQLNEGPRERSGRLFGAAVDAGRGNPPHTDWRRVLEAQTMRALVL